MIRSLFATAFLAACTTPTGDPKDTAISEFPDFDQDGATSEVDCDDRDPTVHPDATETCDGRDEDCDRTVDDGIERTKWYADADGDGYGDEGQVQVDCAAPEGSVADDDDCDDTNADVHPDAPETDCTDPIDYNCDGSTGFDDADGDGFAACQDCDDHEPTAHAGATEVCDAADVDEDCNGLADEADPGAAGIGTWYPDGDGDGYGAGAAVVACDEPAAHAEYAGDCDDADARYNPAAEESDCADPNDYNCDGSTGYSDGDGDGFPACEECDDGDAAVSPAATEICNDTDDDCDGVIDPPTAEGAGDWYADADGDGFGDATVHEVSCDTVVGSVNDASDCDDTDATRFPGAVEVCDGVDQDCALGADDPFDADLDGLADCFDTELCDGLDNDGDGEVDEASAEDAATWYADADGDSFGDVAVSEVACAAPATFVADATDCDDADPGAFPDAVEVCDGVDQDCDATADDGFDADLDGLADCFDTELCDGLDNDGDGEADESEALDAGSWYPDTDGDGFGDASGMVLACTVPAGHVADATDCDDTRDAVFPGADEYCNGYDDDCGGDLDEDDAVDVLTWYADYDGDGFGDAGDGDIDCAAPADFVADATDCDDTAAAVNPDADEVCNGIDDDCAGDVDEDDAVDVITWYADADSDGYGNALVAVAHCAAPAGYVASGADCEDADAAYHPGADETCDGGDDDCDGETDEDSAIDAATWYADADADGFGDAAAPATGCARPTGHVANDTDCLDTDAAVNPGEAEVCDASDTDEDCSGAADDDDAGTVAATFTDWYADVDADEFGAGTAVTRCDAPAAHVATDGDCDDADPDVNPDGVEVCDNGADDDCDASDNGCSWSGTAKPATADYRLYGSNKEDKLGSVAGGGDINNDGYDDVVTGAFGFDSTSSSSTTSIGRAYRIAGPVSSTTVAAATTVTGQSKDEYIGVDVAIVGDTNGDDYDDFLVAGYGYSSSKGLVAVVRGPATTSIVETSAYTYYTGSTNSDQVGSAVAGAGDNDFDGYDDLLLGASGYDSGASNAGAIGLFLGPSTAGNVAFSKASTIFTGETASDAAGGAVAGRCDLDGNYFDDVLMGVSTNKGGASSKGGAAYVSYGPSATGTVKLSAVEAKFSGSSSNQQVGRSVDCAGDVDADGYDDLIVGADQATVGSVAAGSAYLIEGKAVEHTPSAVTTVAGATITGTAADDYLGRTVAGVRDVDGDGFDDILVGATGVDSGSVSGVGAVYLLYGPLSGTIAAASSDLVITSVTASDAFGYDLSRGGDTNDDGFADFLIGYAAADDAKSDVGAMTLWLGGGY